MIGWMLRFLTRLGLRWVVAGAVARYLARRFGRTTVERATEELEVKAQERLPAPLANLVTALPPEAKQIGGSAVVAGRAARGAVNTSRRVGEVATSASRRASAGAGSVRGVLDGVREETESSRRRLQARYLGAQFGADAATDSLLDLRSQPEPRGPDDDLHQRVPSSVASGRRRAIRQTPRVVQRVRRTYRPVRKPWE